MSLQWAAVSAKTGVVICDLPGLSVSSISTVMCGYATAEATLLVDDDTNPAWVEGTLPGGAMLVCLDGETPLWGGIITRRVREPNEPVKMSLATPEAYMDRRFVTVDTILTGEDQNTITETLVDTFVGDTFPITVDAEASAVTRDRTYRAAADKTIYSALVELAGVINGNEWVIGWESSIVDDQQAYMPVLTVADSLGTSPIAGMAPAVTFEYPGVVASFTYTEDYSASSGANDVLAVSTAVEGTRPESSHALYVDALRPTFEHRYTPSSGISDTDTLDDHAEATVARMGEGAIGLGMSADYGTAPKPGVDWVVGDVVGFVVTATEFPGGISGTARVRGWSLKLGETPVLEPFLTEVTLA